MKLIKFSFTTWAHTEASAELVNLVSIQGVSRCLLVSVMSPQVIFREGVSFRKNEESKNKTPHTHTHTLIYVV